MHKPVEKEFHEARQLFFAQFGNALVTNTYLKIALTLVSLVALGLLILNFRTQHMVRNFQPLVIRIDEIGRAQAVAYNDFKYKPQDVEMKYFLSQFCILHYGRNHHTIKDNLPQSLYFLESNMANAVLANLKKTKLIENFLQNAILPDVNIEIKNVVLEEIQHPPFRAKVDMEKVYLNPLDRSEVKRETATVTFVYAFKPAADGPLTPINPLGLMISYFREDTAFK
jgi:type IV secretory pathway TrbF-like protein